MTFRPLYCWSSSGDCVDWLYVGISSPVVGNDWCISTLAWAVVDWRIFILVIQTRDCSLSGLHATFRRFKHRLNIEKIFGVAVAIGSITAGLISTSLVFVGVLQPSTFEQLRIFDISISHTFHFSCFAF